MQLQAGPRERHLGRHDNSRCRGEQEEALAVWLQAPGATQSAERDTEIKMETRVAFPCRDVEKPKGLRKCGLKITGVPLSKALDSLFVTGTNEKPFLDN